MTTADLTRLLVLLAEFRKTAGLDDARVFDCRVVEHYVRYVLEKARYPWGKAGE